MTSKVVVPGIITGIVSENPRIFLLYLTNPGMNFIVTVHMHLGY